jgi:hypothetical protein
VVLVPKVEVDVPEPLYRDVVFYSRLKGTRSDLVVLEALRIYMNMVKDAIDHYRFKCFTVPETARRTMEDAARRGVIKQVLDPGRVALSLSRIVTVLKDRFEEVPREVDVEKLDPESRALIEREIRNIADVLPAFNVEVVVERGVIKKIRFKHPYAVEMYYDYTVCPM